MLFPRLLTSCRNSSNDFSPPVKSSQRPSSLCTSWLSSTLRSSLSSQLLSTRVGSPHLSSTLCSTCPIFLSPVEVTQVQFFFFSPGDLPFQSVDPFDSLKLRSAYFKETLPSAKLSVFDLLNQSLRRNHCCSFRLSYLWILLDCHLLLAQRAPVPMHKVLQHTQTTIGLHHTTIEHIALMHRFQCTSFSTHANSVP